jgi:hypothetical protein
MTPTRTVQDWLESRVSELAGYSLDLRCFAGCTRPGSLDLARVAPQHRNLQLINLVRKLRCKGCGRTPEHVMVHDSPRPGEYVRTRVELF